MSLLVRAQPYAPRQPRAAALLRSALKCAKAAMGWPLRVHANRRLLSQMAGMTAHELADIGLTSADLRDTAALPLDTEIGQFLSSRVSARRRLR